MPNHAVFLDRDGTINEDPGYISDPEKVVLFPETGDALALLKKYRIFTYRNFKPIWNCKRTDDK